MQNQNTCTEGLFQTFEHYFSIMDLVLFPAMKSTYVQSKYVCVCLEGSIWMCLWFCIVVKKPT